MGRMTTKRKRCSYCKENGHTRGGCPKAPPMERRLKGAYYGKGSTLILEEKKTEEIVELYKLGHGVKEIMETLGVSIPRISQALKGVDLREPPRAYISLEDFQRVRAARERGETTIEVAGYLGLPLREINEAWGASSYESYSSGRGVPSKPQVTKPPRGVKYRL